MIKAVLALTATALATFGLGSILLNAAGFFGLTAMATMAVASIFRKRKRT